MAAWLCLLRALLMGALVTGAYALVCERSPEGRRYSDKTPADGRYFIEMYDNPTTYTPNTAYTVSLKAQASPAHHRFIGFLLVAEATDENGSAGTFQITDFLTKYSDRCSNAVTNTNYQPKTEIKTMWTAPPPGSGCIVLKATVIVHHDIWHMDDSPLIKTLCENNQESSDMDASVIDPCCACDEAKYEVTFEGLWSRHTHPKDFPSNGWLTRFSDVIGASHAADYRFWEYGQHASEGLKQLAEHGATKVLESELKAESNHIRTIIKARGISYPNLTGKTFAVFRVDNRHHLMSLVSMIDPSPDWIVGVSGLELCLKNCTWVESKIIKLYPWDAGTDSGPTYLSQDQPTTPRDVIRKIGTRYPNDLRSPFFDPSGKEMKPLARLILSRQRLYEKSCDITGAGSDLGGTSDPCAVTSWGPWSPCTVTCGKGKRYKNRRYRNPGEADSTSCQILLVIKESCYGPRRHCRVPSEYEPDPAQKTGPCALTTWSLWSGCSERCGPGNKVRSRQFMHKGAFKRCHQGHENRPVLQQTIPCIGKEDDCPDYSLLSDDSSEKLKDCPVTEWSEWSPCSASCGKGYKIRSRQRVNPTLPYKKRLSVKGIDDAEEDETNDAEEEQDEEETNENLEEDPCEGVKLEEQVICEGIEKDCNVSYMDSKRICSLPKSVGPCRGFVQRWFFDSNLKRCEPFGFTGCKGNRNNFVKLKDCMRVCRPYRDLTPPNINSANQVICPPPAISGEITGTGITGDGSLSGYDTYACNPNPETNIVVEKPVGEVRNCKVSAWSSWSECEPSCGKGYKIKSRKILQHPYNGGKRCPKELLKKKQCKKNKPCGENDLSDNNESNNEFDSTHPTWGPGDNIVKSDCILSEWSLWSPCSATCGVRAFRQRTRYILSPPTGGGEPCDERIQWKNCDLMPCPHY